MKRTSLIVSVAVIAFATGISVRSLLSAPTESAQQEQQATLPEFSLPDLSGKPRSIKEWRGKILVINFWATWCPPCMKEMPEFEALQQEYGKQGVQFIGIALDEAEPVKAFITKKNITYPILLGEDGGTQLAHGLGNVVDTVPFTVIVDKQGRIILREMGELSRDEFIKAVKPLLSSK